MGKAITPPTSTDRLMRNQKAAFAEFSEPGIESVSNSIVGIIPIITQFIDTVSAKKVLRTAFR